MAAVNSGPSPRAGRTQGRVERGAGMPAGLPALAAPLAALAGMAGVRSAGRALPPPKAAPAARKRPAAKVVDEKPGD